MSSFFSRLKRNKVLRPALAVCLGAGSSFLGYGLAFGNEQLYESLVMPAILKTMDGEQAHNFAVRLASWRLVPIGAKRFGNENGTETEESTNELLGVQAFGRRFSNPIGCAAGFDKNGDAIRGLFQIGFGFVEMGTVTPRPQKGNPKPRVFRLAEDRAIINRYGFNSKGADYALKNVKAFRESHPRAQTTQKEQEQQKMMLGINIGKNKKSTDAVADYLTGMAEFSQYADYMVINISSPNTPGLRNLQSKRELEQLIDPILDARAKSSSTSRTVPVLIKIAPDLSDDELKDIASVAMRDNRRVDGLIVSNTTTARPRELISEEKCETGGLSGRPLRAKSNEVTRRMYELTGGRMSIVGVGGIESGHDALERIKNGASLVQIYTAMIYQGPTVVNRIKRELVTLLRREGYSNLNEAIGANVKLSSSLKK